MAAGSRRRKDVELITDARTSPLADWSHRRRVYLFLQLSRIPLFIASGVVWWLTGNHYWAVGLVLISLPLPWVAVMLANEPGDPDRDSRQVYKPAVVRENRRRLSYSSTELEGTARRELTDRRPYIVDSPDPPDAK